MGKKKVAAAETGAVDAPVKKSKKADGSVDAPFPWTEPYPESVLDKDGKTETVFVLAHVSQDLIINHVKKAAGRNAVIPACTAHENSHVLSAPK